MQTKHMQQTIFQKVNLIQQIHDKAVTLGEERIVALLSEGNLVAI